MLHCDYTGKNTKIAEDRTYTFEKSRLLTIEIIGACDELR